MVDINKEIQELKNRKAVIENEINTIQLISARISMRYGESEEKIDKMEGEIAEINKKIEDLAKNI